MTLKLKNSAIAKNWLQIWNQHRKIYIAIHTQKKKQDKKKELENVNKGISMYSFIFIFFLYLKN